MKVLITGGRGFLGRRLADAICERGSLVGAVGSPEPVEEILLADSAPLPLHDDDRAGAIPRRHVRCDVGEIGDLWPLVAGSDLSIYHLASMVSAECEVDLDRALTVNLDGGRAVLDLARRAGPRTKVCFTSSIAAFGGDLSARVATDETKLTPETTYGMTKAIGELLVNDLSRRGLIDGRSARLPTVVIRPGAPNAAATSWVSGIFREPLSGIDSLLPVRGDLGVPVAGYRSTVANLIALHDLDARALGSDRALNLPALNVTATEMLAVIRAVDPTTLPGGRLGEVAHQVDPATDAFFSRWAQRTGFERASRLGLACETDLSEVIRGFVEDYLGTAAGADETPGSPPVR